jgi:hypothetical protein
LERINPEFDDGRLMRRMNPEVQMYRFLNCSLVHPNDRRLAYDYRLLRAVDRHLSDAATASFPAAIDSIDAHGLA